VRFNNNNILCKTAGNPHQRQRPHWAAAYIQYFVHQVIHTNANGQIGQALIKPGLASETQAIHAASGKLLALVHEAVAFHYAVDLSDKVYAALPESDKKWVVKALTLKPTQLPWSLSTNKTPAQIDAILRRIPNQKGQALRNTEEAELARQAAVF
jgi:hypothetical protein